MLRCDWQRQLSGRSPGRVLFREENPRRWISSKFRCLIFQSRECRHGRVATAQSDKVLFNDRPTDISCLPTSFGSIDDLRYLENIVNWKLPTRFISRARARTRARASIFSHGLFNYVDKRGHGHEPVPTKILTPLLQGSSRGSSRAPNSNLGGGSPSGSKELNVLGLPGTLVPGRQVKIRGLNVPRQSGTSKRRVEHNSSLLLWQKKPAVFPQSTPTLRPRLLLHTPTPNPLREDKSPFASGLKFSLKRS
ncbi:hypothetical protein F5882DRAFT_438833 [Hyaloscypha sp. PMI_1271]|nr:hypothetical protein F5882DRAFT_438833 [Hyaloscypha sp. PMI_1271]